MENQHRQIKGYRDLSQAEIDLMNKAKAAAEQVGALIGEIRAVALQPGVGGSVPIDLRWLAIGETDLQKGFMAVVRSIAKPGSF